MLTPPRAESIPALLGLFYPVFGLAEGSRWLSTPELVAAVTADDAADRFIGGSVDRKAKTLTLLRGDITTIVAPFRLFPNSGDGTAPDFAKLRLTDYGRTIALGDYEASADAVLYELDPDYRRRLNTQRRARERTFGAALQRLRKQRRLRRTDFAPISSREIAHRARRGRQAAREDSGSCCRSAGSSSAGDRELLMYNFRHAREKCGMVTGHFAGGVFRSIIFLRETHREWGCREIAGWTNPRRKLFGNSVVRQIFRRAPLSRTGTGYERGSSVRRSSRRSLASLPTAPTSRGRARKPLFCKWPRGGPSSTSTTMWPH